MIYQKKFNGDAGDEISKDPVDPLTGVKEVSL